MNVWPLGTTRDCLSMKVFVRKICERVTPLSLHIYIYIYMCVCVCVCVCECVNNMFITAMRTLNIYKYHQPEIINWHYNNNNNDNLFVCGQKVNRFHIHQNPSSDIIILVWGNLWLDILVVFNVLWIGFYVESEDCNTGLACVCVCVHIHTHTHTHRERERERKRDLATSTHTQAPSMLQMYV